MQSSKGFPTALMTTLLFAVAIAVINPTVALGQLDGGIDCVGDFVSDAADRVGDAAEEIYILEIEGRIFGKFGAVSGIGSESEILEFREGTDTPQVVRKMPGQLQYSDITLKRGITSNLDTWDWRKQVEDGEIEEARVNGAIILQRRNRPVARWEFERGWPSKISAPSPTSESCTIGVETLTIVHEHIVRVH